MAIQNTHNPFLTDKNALSQADLDYLQIFVPAPDDCPLATNTRTQHIALAPFVRIHRRSHHDWNGHHADLLSLPFSMDE
uniref:Uncharacterized protein n=1 Tax=Oryza barthii TaxID=65489 RepID=A0A0D3HG01_9ORYZ